MVIYWEGRFFGDNMAEDQDTYSKLFETLGKERNTLELLKLEDDLIIKINDEIRTNKIQDERIMDNMKRMVKELRERREKKIILIAWTYIKTKSNIIDFSCMLPNEKDLYERIVKSLESYKSDFLANEAKYEQLQTA